MPDSGGRAFLQPRSLHQATGYGADPFHASAVSSDPDRARRRHGVRGAVGQNLALMETFRGIYEPFNHNRKIIGFDTFEGFPAIHEKDGKSEVAKAGAYSVTKDYE